MKMLKWASVSLIITAILPGLSFGESEYDAWLKAEKQEFQDYVDANDKEFIGFLKQQWKEVDVKAPVKRDPKPKPRVLPPAPEAKPTANIADDKKAPLKSSNVKTKKPTIVQPIKVAKPKPVSKPKPPTIAKRPKQEIIQFEYFGHTVSVTKERGLKQSFNGRLNNKSIAEYWLKLASKPHKKTVAALKSEAKRLRLNDWGTALLFDHYVQAIKTNNNTSHQLTTWFLLVKAGYNARVAYNRNAFLLMPSKQALYGITYFTFKKKRYYAVNLNGNKVDTGKAFTYSGKHSDGLNSLNFDGANNIVPSGKRQARDLAFKYNGKPYKLSVHYDRGLVDYSSTVPQMDLPNYFAEGLPRDTAYELLNQLKPIVEGQTEKEAVNRIMRFVQTAFQYKTDGDQFNFENYLYPVETLHYPYSDCEDRAAIFAWLTKSLLKLDVVILDYPGHVAAGVAFTDKVQGDNWKFKGKRYTVTDPTYINSTVGMTMPHFKKIKPKIVTF